MPCLPVIPSIFIPLRYCLLHGSVPRIVEDIIRTVLSWKVISMHSSIIPMSSRHGHSHVSRYVLPTEALGRGSQHRT